MSVTGITQACDADHCNLCASLYSTSETYDLAEKNKEFEMDGTFSSMRYIPARERFVAWWGEIGTKWGVNRTVAEIHALFYISSEPLNAEDIVQALEMSRSNVSASVRELENRGLITPVHFRGDRKRYYEAIKDPWEMFRVILDERKRREVDPTLTTLRDCLEELTRSTPEDSYTQDRLRTLLEFFEAMIPLYDEFRRLPRGPINVLTKVTAKVRETIG